MKILFLTLFLASCSSLHLERKVSDDKNDAFKDESYFRYSDSRLLSSKSKNNKIHSALISCHDGDIRQGKEDLKKILNSNRENPDYWSALANCLYLDGYLNQAEYFFQISLSKDKKHIPSLNNLALISLQRGHTNEAIDLFKQAIQYEPNTKLIQYNYAQVLLEIERFKQAMSIFKRLYQFNPRDPDIIAAYAISVLLNGRPEYSLKLFDKVDESTRRRVDNALYIALNYIELEQYQKAKDFLESFQTPLIKDLRISKAKLSSIALKKIDELNKLEETGNSNEK